MLDRMQRDMSCLCGDPDCGAIKCGCGGDVVITGCAIMTESGPIQVTVKDGVLETEKTDGVVGEGAGVLFTCCIECGALIGFGLMEENSRVYTTDGRILPSEVDPEEDSSDG